MSKKPPTPPDQITAGQNLALKLYQNVLPYRMEDFIATAKTLDRMGLSQESFMVWFVGGFASYPVLSLSAVDLPKAALEFGASEIGLPPDFIDSLYTVAVQSQNYKRLREILDKYQQKDRTSVWEYFSLMLEASFPPLIVTGKPQQKDSPQLP